MTSRPNILLIYTDQQRRDSLGCYGNDLIRTPHLDALASEGTLVEDCHVSCPLCVPSRVAFWTGRYGANTGSLGNQPNHLLHTDCMDMARFFRDHGYRTGLAGKNHCFPEERLRNAFDHTSIVSHRGFSDPASDIQHRIREARTDSMQMPYLEDPIPPEENITRWCFDQAEAFMEQHAEEAFFCWLSIPDPHPPFMVCEPYASMYQEIDPPPPVWSEGQMEGRPFRQQLAARLNRLALQYPGEDIKQLQRIYWGMVSQIDDGVGHLLAFLEEKGLAENTIVIFTSDHGEYLGDHRMVRKGIMNAPCLTAVPLLFRWPGHIQSQRSNAQASNVDLFPTLCELAGLPPPAGLQGISLAPHLMDGDAPARTEVFSHFGLPGHFLSPEDPEVEELLHAPYDPRQKGHPLLSDAMQRGLSITARNTEWSFTWNVGECDELYHRQQDPHEQWNLAAEERYADIVSGMKNRVFTWLATVTMGAAPLQKCVDTSWQPKA